MISITHIIVGSDPPFVVEELPSSSHGTLNSRVSRVATLDGGSVMVNSGVSESDRTITIEAEITEAQGIALEAMRARSPLVNMSTRNGFYYGAIDGISYDNGVLKLTFLVRAKSV
ncbi:hypothetical protein [Desulfoluna spongiiphila]|uniref:hypothetical protein n=1 Tax=Desulfoluna spongiiphila TaxID=419481 RepID=UPI0012534C82|nr:hypothetical protein [Desulfoluna spongiiphila]VVS95357.1 hypothetical protein DBB_49340 [Desulfoluna spongiiphila]